MPVTRVPLIPSNLPPESQQWGRDAITAKINELVAAVNALESQVAALSARR